MDTAIYYTVRRGAHIYPPLSWFQAQHAFFSLDYALHYDALTYSSSTEYYASPKKTVFLKRNLAHCRNYIKNVRK